MTMPSSTCFRTDTICFAGKDLHLIARLSGKELNDQKLESRISHCADIRLGNRASVLNPVEVDPNSPSGGATSSVISSSSFSKDSGFIYASSSSRAPRLSLRHEFERRADDLL